MNKTTLIVNGLTLDKAVFQNILRRVANDGHIHYAIKRIKNHYTEQKSIERAKRLSGVVEVISWFPGVNILSPLKFIADISLDKIENKIPLYADKADLTGKNNFDYWNIFFSNLSDTQTLISSAIQNKKTKQIYCARPYYENKYIDSIIIEIKRTDNITKEVIEKLINTHIESVFCAEWIYKGIENVDGLDSYTKKRIKTTLAERGPFGIYFLSGFLKELYKDEEIAFEYSKNLIADRGSLNEDGVFFRELILLAGNPGKIKFCSSGKEDCNNTIRLIQIENKVSQNNAKDSFKDLFDGSVSDGYIKVLIPIKRIISMPQSYIKQLESLNRIPAPYETEIYPLPDVFMKDNLRIFTIGGGEHNLPLVHLINIMRYKDSGDRRFGFLENAFDREMRDGKKGFPEFLITLEKFVSGLNAAVKTRATTDTSPAPMKIEVQSNEAEILRIKFNEKIEGYAIYGFSAPMTRYAFLGLLYALDEQNDDLFSEFINDRHHKYERIRYIDFGTTNIAVYYIGEKEYEFLNLRNKFDEMDVMNNFEEPSVKKLIIKNLFLRSRG